MECVHCRKYLTGKIHLELRLIGKCGNDLMADKFCNAICMQEWGLKNLIKILDNL